MPPATAPSTSDRARATAAAYSATGSAWVTGPGAIYDRLAETVTAACPGGVAGRRVLDVGAGTGAATRAARRAGAMSVVAVDVAAGMLRAAGADGAPAVVGDVVRLPFGDRSFDAAVAAFSLNHVSDPVAALGEVARAVGPGGGIVASTYAVGDAHPVKAAVDDAAARRGWRIPGWSRALRDQVMPLLASVDRAVQVGEAAGLHEVEAGERRVAFPDLTVDDLIAWRLGMAPLAPFVASLTAPERRALVADAHDLVGPDPPGLVRSIVVLTGRG